MSYHALSADNGDGANRLFNVPFPYIAATDVHVFVAGVEVTYTWVNSSNIQTATAPDPGTGNVLVLRTTESDVNLHTIQTGTILPADINANHLQLLYLIQELEDQATYYQLPDLAADVAAALAAATNAVNLANAALAAITAAGLPGARSYTGAVVTISTAISAAIETYFVNAAGATTQTLPAAPTLAEKHTVKDMGANAATNRITVSGNGKNIDGQANWYIDADRGWVTVQYNGTEWSVIS